MYPDELTVASGGPAGTAQSDLMGVFLKEDSQQYNNRPVYRLDGGGQYLYYIDAGYWVIGTTLGGAVGIATLQKGLLTPPATGWKYYSSASGWEEDPQLTVSGEAITMHVSSLGHNSAIYRKCHQ